MENQSDIGTALVSLTDALKKRERELEEREAELSEKRKRLNDDITDVYGETGPSDVLHLNIGGQKIDVLRRTLCSVEGSMLASRFSGRWDDSLEKDENGHFFLDEDFKEFKLMIEFLRDKAKETPKYPVEAPAGYGKFYRMLEYYGMTDGVYRTWFEPTFVPDDGNEAFVLTKGKEINAKEWCTFELKQQHHSRTIKSFEVQLGEIQRLQIGLHTYDYDKTPFNYSQSTGVGDISQSNGLDPLRSCVINAGTRSDIPAIELKDGTVIKIELDGNWYLDGKLIASRDGRDGSAKMLQYSGYDDGPVPAISIKGEAKLVNIDYTN